MTFETKIGDNQLITARAFYTTRSVLNRLAVASNGYGDLERAYSGLGATYELDEKFWGMKYRLKIGLDIDNQEDTRKRYAFKKVVVEGVTSYVQDTLVLNQLESYKSTGVYALQELQITKRLLVSFGVRYDDLNLGVADHFLIDGDQSATRHYDKVNPMVGVSYGLGGRASIYANYSTTFETPTLQELSNNPNGTGGFNPTLLPMQAKSFEIGTKGRVFGSLAFDMALFHIESQNDLVPFQIAGQTGKTYYRNAGATLRNGVELGLSYQIAKGLTLNYTQTYSDFTYETYLVNTTSYDGNTMPGIPKMNIQFELRYVDPTGLFVIAQVRNESKMFADDANDATAPGFTVVNLRMGNTFVMRGYEIEPYFAVNNLGNALYMANVQVNATSNRYYEPASKQYLFGGVKFRLK